MKGRIQKNIITNKEQELVKGELLAKLNERKQILGYIEKKSVDPATGPTDLGISTTLLTLGSHRRVGQRGSLVRPR